MVLCWALSACEKELGRVIEGVNEFGGKTIEYLEPVNTRMSKKVEFSDNTGRIRIVERYLLPDAAQNLGFEKQITKYNTEGTLIEDLRLSPEGLNNEWGYLSYQKFFSDKNRLTNALIQYKPSKAREQGFWSSAVLYDEKGKISKITYFDDQKNVISPSVKPAP